VTWPARVRSSELLSHHLLLAIACLSRSGWDAPEDNSNNDANAHEQEALAQVTERPIQTSQKTAHGDDARGHAYSEIKHSAPVRWLWVVQWHNSHNDG
jgi:hypothetical protein